MGIEKLICGYCGHIFHDAMDYDYCYGCETSFCTECRKNKTSLLCGCVGIGEECPHKRRECTCCTTDYSKRKIKNNELITFLISKCGYKSKKEAVEDFRKSMNTETGKKQLTN